MSIRRIHIHTMLLRRHAPAWIMNWNVYLCPNLHCPDQLIPQIKRILGLIFFFQIEILCRLNDFSFSFLFSVGEQRGCRLYTVMLHNFRNSIPSHTSLPLSCSMLRKYIILISQCTIRLLTTKRPFFLGQTDTKTIHQFYIYPPSKNGRLIHCSFITLKQYYNHIELLQGDN